MKIGFDCIGIVVATLCHDGQGNYAMMKRSSKSRDSHGFWDFGGGTVEFGEKLEETLVREVKEEFGVVPISYTQIGTRDIIDTEAKKHWIGVFYKVEVDRDTVYNAEPETHEDLQWFKLPDVPSPLRPIVVDQIEAFKNFLY